MINRPKICYIGGEDIHFRIPILNALRNIGYDVCALGSEDSKLFNEAGIAYERYSLSRWISPFADYKSIAQLKEKLMDLKPNIIHAFDTKPAILAMLAGSQANIPIKVRTITGLGYLFSVETFLTHSLKPIYSLLQKKASRYSQMTIFQNPDDRQYFMSAGLVGATNSRLVYGSGVDFSIFTIDYNKNDRRKNIRKLLKVDDEHVILMIARLVKTKGVNEYLRAAKIVKEYNPNVKFFLVGPLSSEGRQALSREKIQKYSSWVEYLGVREDIPQLLEAADIFVLPSYYREGVPRVLLEAGAMGLPIITTNTPGCKEVINEEKNGWLIAPRDAQQLANRILESVKYSHRELSGIGQHGIAYIREKFSLENVANEYSNIYEELMRAKKMVS